MYTMSRYIVKTMHLKKLKRIVMWDRGVGVIFLFIHVWEDHSQWNYSRYIHHGSCLGELLNKKSTVTICDCLWA